MGDGYSVFPSGWQRTGPAVQHPTEHHRGRLTSAVQVSNRAGAATWIKVSFPRCRGAATDPTLHEPGSLPLLRPLMKERFPIDKLGHGIEGADEPTGGWKVRGDAVCGPKPRFRNLRGPVTRVHP